MNKSILSAVVIVVVLALWMLSGLLPGRSDADESNAATASTQSDQSDGTSKNAANDTDQRLMKVEVMRINASEVTRELTLQGQLEPLRRLQIVGQISGLVDVIPATRGQRVKRGDLLVKLDLETTVATALP